MSSFPAEKKLLVALNQGLPPHAEPLSCDDLRGSHSLFGEGMKMPRPIRRLHPSRNSSACLSPDWSRMGGDPYTCCSVLWESSCPATSSEAAEIIAKGNDPTHSFAAELSVPATVYIAGESTSTFSVAWQLLSDGYLPEWGAVISSCQKEGRGQLRREWHSPRGNLYVSFRLPDSPVLHGDAASLIAGYLIVRAFRDLGFPLSLKWPNDLVLHEKFKVGGLLLEEKDGVLMAGLGVNLAEAPSEAVLRKGHAMRSAVLLPHHALRRTPGCLSCSTDGEGWSEDLPLAPFCVWKQLVTRVILEYSHFVARLGLPYVLANLNGADTSRAIHASGNAAVHAEAMPAILAWKGKSVIQADNDGISGRCLGIGPCGGLLLALTDGKEQEFFSGSFSLAE